MHSRKKTQQKTLWSWLAAKKKQQRLSQRSQTTENYAVNGLSCFRYRKDCVYFKKKKKEKDGIIYKDLLENRVFFSSGYENQTKPMSNGYFRRRLITSRRRLCVSCSGQRIMKEKICFHSALESGVVMQRLTETSRLCCDKQIRVFEVKDQCFLMKYKCQNQTFHRCYISQNLP